MAIIIGAAHIKPGPGSLTAEAGNDASLGLLVSGINSPNLDPPTHQAQEPVVTVHPIVLQVQMQRLIPGEEEKMVDYTAVMILDLHTHVLLFFPPALSLYSSNIFQSVGHRL